MSVEEDLDILDDLWDDREGDDFEIEEFVEDAKSLGMSSEIIKDFLGGVFGNASDSDLAYWVDDEDKDEDDEE